MMFEALNWPLIGIILVGSLVTLLNRLAGHFVLAKFEPIPPRVEAALDAVPIAVMTTLVVPAAVDGGPIEWLTLIAAAILSLRLPFLAAAGLALLLLIVMRRNGF